MTTQQHYGFHTDQQLEALYLESAGLMRKYQYDPVALRIVRPIYAGVKAELEARKGR